MPKGGIMRYLVMLVGILSLANASIARDNVILSKEISGGNAPPEMAGWSNQILIYESGRVTDRHRSNSSSPWIENELAIINSSIMSGIIAHLAGLQNGELHYEDTPICYDFPTTHYVGVVDGKDVIFGAHSQCRIGTLPEFDPASVLMYLLDGQDSLALYVPVK